MRRSSINQSIKIENVWSLSNGVRDVAVRMPVAVIVLTWSTPVRVPVVVAAGGGAARSGRW